MWKDFKSEIKQQSYIEVERLQVRNQTTIQCKVKKLQVGNQTIILC